MNFGTKKLIEIDKKLIEVSRKKRSESNGKVSLYEIAKIYLLWTGKDPSEENIKLFIKEF